MAHFIVAQHIHHDADPVSLVNGEDGRSGLFEPARNMLGRTVLLEADQQAIDRLIDKPLIPFVPSPWNLFMRAKVKEDGAIEYARPPYIPDGRVTLRMQRDATIIVSACPDDCYPTNGGDGSPRDFTIEIRR